MMLLSLLIICFQLGVVLAVPTSNPRFWKPESRSLSLLQRVGADSVLNIPRAAAGNTNQQSASAYNKPISQGGIGGNAGEEADNEQDENNVNGVFNQTIQLGGNNVKTDVLFTKSAVGSLEVEFQNNVGRTLTVNENKNPAAPPAGFKALEPSSFQINLAEGANGLTLQKVDYIVDVKNPNVAAQDISQGRVGKLCTETNTFIVDPAIGEFEFEAEENELSLTVDNMNGEWGIFIPQTAGNGSNTGNTSSAGENNGSSNGNNNGNNNGNMANSGQAPNAGGSTDTAPAGNAEEEADETNVNGTFDTAVSVPGGNAKTDIQFTPSAAGNLEVEYNGTAANAITVTPNANPASPPAGMLFVDPTTFQIQTRDATDPATDTVKVDYIFTQAVKTVADVNQGTIGKLDPATNTFTTQGLGEFEFEKEEDEWSLTVPNLNGEWAILIPQAAINT